MQIKMSVTLHMSDEQMRSWADEYGLDMNEVAADAREMIAGLVHEQIKQMMHVREFTSLTGFTVK